MQFHWYRQSSASLILRCCCCRWEYEDERYIETLKHMQTLQQAGKIKLLAVWSVCIPSCLTRMLQLTNFDTIRLKQILDAGIPVVSNQVQFSILDRRCNAAPAACCAH